ncbi:MAG: glycosyltransferase family 4 protein [Bacteroidales bacterium]|nr:glycosyltransferase family 4 protein [Bacteroidales bacterium]
MHDLIFFRYPKLYNPADRVIYRKKFGYACKVAHKIVSVSKQTANDLIEFLGVNPERIEVVYQGCNTAFEIEKSIDEKNEVRKKYGLPGEFILYVGTIEERKNLLGLVKAIYEGNIDVPLVAIGRKTDYFRQVQEFITNHKVANIIFIDTLKNEDLPAMYQMAKVFVYPSFFEGFGIPILESLQSGTPVITSKGGCFPESGGSSSCYIDPLNSEEIADNLKKILSDTNLRNHMIDEGRKYARNFSDEKIAANMMNVYQKTLNL